jgi:hypothetical protein
MKHLYCSVCGGLITAGKIKLGADLRPVCRLHPEARRYPETWATKQFADMRAAADAAVQPVTRPRTMAYLNTRAIMEIATPAAAFCREVAA